MLIRLLKDRRGATAIEYGLIVALIVLVVVVGISLLGDATQERYENIATQVDDAM